MDTECAKIFNESGVIVPFDINSLLFIIGELEKRESCSFQWIEIVFVTDKKILELNKKYLNHDYITDIITFPYHEDAELPEGTLFCCAPQIERQADEYQTDYKTEIIRVVIHGLLHLAGYNDFNSEEKKEIRRLENQYIEIYHNAQLSK